MAWHEEVLTSENGSIFYKGRIQGGLLPHDDSPIKWPSSHENRRVFLGSMLALCSRGRVSTMASWNGRTSTIAQAVVLANYWTSYQFIIPYIY